MISIRYAETSDKDDRLAIDTHLLPSEFEQKVRERRAYILSDGADTVGVMRYQLCWDSIPFLTLLFIEPPYRRMGVGTEAMRAWESDMRRAGFGMCLVSTQVDEDAQHFYRKLGYKDCGCLVLDMPGYKQPMEMFLAKAL